MEWTENGNEIWWEEALCGKCPTIWINLTSQFQCIRGGQVRVGRGHGEDEGVWIGDEGQDHLLYLSLDVLWLVPNRNLKQQQWAAGVTVSTAQMGSCWDSALVAWLNATKSGHIEQNEHLWHLAEFTFVIPGKSTRVRFRTLGEKIFRYMGSGLIPWGAWRKEQIILAV